MMLMINKQDLKNILAWAGQAQVNAEETGIPFEADELETLRKLKE